MRVCMERQFQFLVIMFLDQLFISTDVAAICMSPVNDIMFGTYPAWDSLLNIDFTILLYSHVG